MSSIHRLVVVLGDQLDHQSAAFDDFDPARDAVWMAEVTEESTHVWSHKARIVMFLSAMRHFAEELRDKDWRVEYIALDAEHNTGSLRGELERAIAKLKPRRIVMAESGDWRVQESLRKFPVEIRPDRHFYCSREEFAAWAKPRKQLRMEYFYREMRKKTGALMDDGHPTGGEWNFDAENRESFGKSGPGAIPAPKPFPPDSITREVIRLVNHKFADHPGNLSHFDFPVTAHDAKAALRDFIEHRLAEFGKWQDAMWTDEPYLYHSRISAAMNLKLLNPREAVAAAERAYRRGEAPLAAVEGFIRQILGWREYVRGIYWTYMPAYAQGNALGAAEPLPAFYWTGKTQMNCLRQALGQTLEYGYAHHIQRLMVTGLFTLLLGVEPLEVHKWYLAVYVDAVEWVELPNTVGMSQFADGGLMASKPYVATGKYIARMSNYCKQCRYKPEEATGGSACPFTTLYWDFLLRHETKLLANERMKLQVRNLARMAPAKKHEIQERAASIRENVNEF